MPSRFDGVVKRRGAPLLVRTFAERDGQGDIQSRKYYPPGNKPAIEISGGIVGQIQSAREVDEINGDVSAMERRTWTVRTNLLIAGGVTRLQDNAAVELRDGRWAVDLDQSSWGESLVTFSLVRKPLLSGKRYERGTV